MSDLIILSDAQRRTAVKRAALLGISVEDYITRAFAAELASATPEELLVPLRNCGGWRE